MENDSRKRAPQPEAKQDYEAPDVERVMDADELAREVHYAGERISGVV